MKIALRLFFLLLIALQAQAAGLAWPGGFTSNEDELLPAEKAFRLSMTTRAGRVVGLFEPAASYYLYRERIQFSVIGGTGYKIRQVVMPKGDKKQDPTFGEVAVFHQPFEALVELDRAADASPELTLKARYQGCSEKGVCYPPVEKSFQVSFAPGGKVSPLPQPARK